MMPVIPIAKPAIAPCVCPHFIAVPVPMACPVPPKARPTATGSSIFSSFKRLDQEHLSEFLLQQRLQE